MHTTADLGFPQTTLQPGPKVVPALLSSQGTTCGFPTGGSVIVQAEKIPWQQLPTRDSIAPAVTFEPETNCEMRFYSTQNI